MRRPLETVSDDTGRTVSSNSWSRNHDSSPSVPPPLNMFSDTGLRLSVFSHDQKLLKPLVRTRGPPRVSRSSSVGLLNPMPPPTDQLFLKLRLPLTFPALTRRSPSVFHIANWLKLMFRLRKNLVGTSLRSWNQLAIQRSSARRRNPISFMS